MKPKKLTQDQIQSTLSGAIKDAVAFIESEIAPDRIKAQKYFDGGVELESEEGRSKVVATKCRDTIRAVKPSLMRVFLQSGRPVEFVPRRPQSMQEAEAKTQYASYVFDRNEGFQLLSDVFDDALKKKVGILKVWYDETACVEVDNYTGLSEEQIAFLTSDPEIEILEQEAEQEAAFTPDGIMVSPAIYSAKVARTSRNGEIKIKAVAPEDFFVDRSATSIDDCFVCGHSTESRVGEVVDMGFDFEEVFDLAGLGGNDDTEEFGRRGYDEENDESANDPSMRKVLLTEAYMKMDIDGTGVPRLYKFICASENYTILDYELADVNPFAVFEVDPEAHTFFGRSLVDIIIDDQDAATSLLRGLLDNISMVNNPRLEVVESAVNMGDVLNNEIGAIIRSKAQGSVRELTIGGMASSVLPAIGYYDEVIRAKTGVSGAGMGMDADVLQSQTAQGVNAAVQAANQVSELIARHLAEGGMKRLFRIIAQLARQHPNPDEVMRVNGQFVPVDPRSWTADADLICNVGLGTGKHEERAMVLREVLQNQMGIWQSYGPQNGVVTMTNIRNTLADILAHSGLHNAERYYQPMTPEREQQLLAQAAQASQGQQQGSDPNAAFLQAEQMKMSARVQADMEKNQLDAQRARMDDDRQRDQMAQDLYIKQAEIQAKYGAQVNIAQIKAEQDAVRGMMQPAMQPQGMQP